VCKAVLESKVSVRLNEAVCDAKSAEVHTVINRGKCCGIWETGLSRVGFVFAFVKRK
jgi:hypothetical protein